MNRSGLLSGLEGLGLNVYTGMFSKCSVGMCIWNRGKQWLSVTQVCGVVTYESSGTEANNGSAWPKCVVLLHMNPLEQRQTMAQRDPSVWCCYIWIIWNIGKQWLSVTQVCGVVTYESSGTEANNGSVWPKCVVLLHMNHLEHRQTMAQRDPSLWCCYIWIIWNIGKQWLSVTQVCGVVTYESSGT